MKTAVVILSIVLSASLMEVCDAHAPTCPWNQYPHRCRDQCISSGCRSGYCQNWTCKCNGPCGKKKRSVEEDQPVIQSDLNLGLLKANPLSLTVNGGKDITISGLLLQNEVCDINKPNLQMLVKMMIETQEKLDDVTTKLNNVTQVVNEYKQHLLRVEKTVDAIKDPSGYLGCYNDDENRHLPDKVQSFDDASLAKCREHCKGYKYVGLQVSSYCLCGNELDKKGYSRVSESECNMACSGEPNRMCGAGWRNSVYRV